MCDEIKINGNLIDTIKKLKIHDHICIVYETKEEQFSSIVPFIKIGLKRGEKCIYVVDDNTSQVVLEAMQKDGIDTESAIKSGSLNILTKQDSYLKQGYFDPEWMIQFLKKATDSAKKEGFKALRATGEMTWFLEGNPGIEKLKEYEAKLNYFFSENDALAICQYNRNRFSSEIILNIIHTHPIVIYGDLVCRNAYYIPPEEFLKPNQTDLEVKRLFYNITERERIEALNQENEEKYQDLYDNAPDVFASVDVKTAKILRCNQTFVRTLGYNMEEIIGRPIHFFYHPDCMEDVNKTLKSFVTTGEVHNAELLMKRKDGSEIDVILNMSAVHDEQGNILYCRSVWRDITKRKQLEENVRISYKMASLGQLSAGVFHEILNPVNIISSHVQLLLMEADKGSKTEEDLKSIQEEIERIVKITDGLLRYSRMEKRIIEEIDINSLLEIVKSIVEPEMKLDNINIIKQLEEKLPTIKGSGDEIRQVFLNLITNARAAMPEGGTLTISTQSAKMTTNPSLRVKVTDTGCGIDKKDIDKIFDPFFTSKKEGKGVGLGLSILYTIIENHRGTISVDSEVGRGTTFTIDLPIKTILKHEQSGIS